MSLSLDGLLDYNDKDIEESTFEVCHPFFQCSYIHFFNRITILTSSGWIAFWMDSIL